MAQPEVQHLVNMLQATDDKAEYGERQGLPVIHSRAPAVPAKLTKLVLIPVNCDLRQAWLLDLQDCVWGGSYGNGSDPSVSEEYSHGVNVLVWPSTLRPPTSTVLSVEDFWQGGSEMLKVMVAPALVKAGYEWHADRCSSA